MKRILLTIFAVCFALISCEKDEPDRDIDNSRLQTRTVVSQALFGNLAGNNHVRKIQVYTPPGYRSSSNQSYPVVYLLHGFPFSEKAFTDMSEWDAWLTPYLFSQEYPDFPQEGFKQWIDNLIAAEVIEPMIIVMPNAETQPYGFSFYTNSILNGNFEDFIVEDVVNYMDENFNTIDDPSGRAVIGHSQGGYAAFKFGTLHPDVFGTVASHSGLLLVDALFGLTDAIEQENPGGFTGPDPTKFLTSAMYAMSAAWSPNPNNAPFMVDLPFEFHSDGHLYPVPTIVQKWHQNDVFTLLDTYHDVFNASDGIYFDVGTIDELGTHLAHEPVIMKMNSFNMDYTFETYEGGHHTHMFARLAKSLEFVSNSMN